MKYESELHYIIILPFSQTKSNICCASSTFSLDVTVNITLFHSIRLLFRAFCITPSQFYLSR